MGTVLYLAAGVLLLAVLVSYLRRRFHNFRPYFADKHIWLVGASSGIGRDLAVLLGECSRVKLTLSGRRTEAMQELRKEILAAHPATSVLVITLDTRSPAATIEAAYTEAVTRHGDVDVLIYNSGINQNHRLTQDLTFEEASSVLNTNLMGGVYCILACVPAMVKRNSGHIVTISSLAGHLGLPRAGAYSGSKAGLSAFVDSLRVDLRGSRIHVTDVQPGFVATPILEGAKHPTPFLMDSKTASMNILKGISALKKTETFPLVLYVAVLLGHLAPHSLLKFVFGDSKHSSGDKL
jgi:short-subunit dehydrogenase